MSFVKLSAVSNNIAIVKTVTWKRDSHGLFDYESRQVQRNSLEAPQGGWFYRTSEEEVKFCHDLASCTNTTNKFLAKLIDDHGFQKLVGLDYYKSLPVLEMKRILDPTEAKVIETISEIQMEKSWLVVRSINSSYEQGFKLSVGDILKLGRVKFKIKEVKHDKLLETMENESKEDEHSNEAQAEVSEVSGEENGEFLSEFACRICLCETFTVENPLVNLCLCSGSVKFMHIVCLQDWLKARLNVRTTNSSVSQYWKNFDCELCKTSYPQTISQSVREFRTKKDLIHIPRPTAENYLMLEAIAKDRRSAGGVHIISLAKNKNMIKLGRGSDSDIRISDISVSRCHAIISFRNNGQQMEDNSSKFGTLVRVKRPLLLDQLSHTSIQIGRTVLSFCVKKQVKNNVMFRNTDTAKFMRDEGNPQMRTTLENILFQKQQHVIPEHTIYNQLVENEIPESEYNQSNNMDAINNGDDTKTVHIK